MKKRLAEKISKKIWRINNYYYENGRMQELVEKVDKYDMEGDFKALKKIWYYNYYLQERAMTRIDQYKNRK